MRSSGGWRLGMGSLGIMLVSRTLMLRDAVTGVARRLPKPKRAENFFFASGGRRLAAVFVAGDDALPVILLCHGIGETVGHWSAVQAFFEERGVGSTVFNYSGYGRSSGAIRVENCVCGAAAEGGGGTAGVCVGVFAGERDCGVRGGEAAAGVGRVVSLRGVYFVS